VAALDTRPSDSEPCAAEICRRRERATVNSATSPGTCLLARAFTASRSGKIKQHGVLFTGLR